MHEYSLAVALFDYLPVACSALAMVILARTISRRHHALATIAWVGALAIPLGGACKASWKLTIAATGNDIALLNNLLFILLAPGFVIMAYGLSHARRAWTAGTAPERAAHSPVRLAMWLAIPILGAAGAALVWPDTRIWFFWLLGVTTLANATLLVHGIGAARDGELGWGVVSLFVYSFFATLALSGLSRLPAGEMTAWIQESVNLSAQGALALGFWRLGRRMQEGSP